jgi:hypothetical protein
VDLGQRVIWLHTYGDRFADAAAGRPAGPPCAPGGPPCAPGGPTIPAGGAISSDPAKFRDDLRYDATAQRLYVGEGFIDNVPQAVRDYEVSGRNVIDQWFSYRRKDRSRPIIGDRRPPSPLDSVQPERWPSSYTEDLLNLLYVIRLLTELEPAQADLLERICTGPLIDAEVLRAQGLLGRITV